MEYENLEKTVVQLDAQMPLLRARMNKTDVKVDKIDADQRRTMVLFEDTEGKFKMAVEAYVGLDAKMGRIEVDVQDLKGRVSRLEERVASLETLAKDGFELLSRKIDQLARPAA